MNSKMGERKGQPKRQKPIPPFRHEANPNNRLLGMPFVELHSEKKNQRVTQAPTIACGVAMWKMIIVLVIGIYIIVLPYSTSDSVHQSSIWLYITCITALIYSIIIFIWYCRIIPTRIKYCTEQKRLRKAQKIVNLQKQRQTKKTIDVKVQQQQPKQISA